MLLAEPNVAIRLVTVVSDGNASLYCRGTVYDNVGASIGTVSLPSAGAGIYAAQYTFSAAGKYSVVYRMYTDAGFTTLSQYDQGLDTVDVSDFKDNIMRILGLLHENTVVDAQVYDGSGFLTSSRIRAYDSKANALLAGATGLLDTWTMTATYTGANLTKYGIVRE